MKIFQAIFLTLLLLSNLSGFSKNTTPLEDLFPNLVDIPALELGIPENFVVGSPKKESDITDGVYWGPKEVLEAYFNDSKSLNQGIMKVKLLNEVLQTGPENFSCETSKNKSITISKKKWGEYPVLAFNSKSKNKREQYALFLGLNSPGQWVLAFDFIYPENEKFPSKNTLKIWEDLLEQTKGLSTQELLKVKGQDMQEDYTNALVYGSKMQFIVEERIRDGRVRLIVKRLEGKIEFQLEDVETGKMPLEWKKGTTLAKVHGTITAYKDSTNSVVQQTPINVFIKRVKEFTDDSDQLQNDPSIQVYEFK
jgi:hypothetical protein